MRWSALALAPLVGMLVLAGCGLPGALQPLPEAAVILQRAQTAKITDMTFTATGDFTSSLGALLGGQSGDGSNSTFQAYITGKITMSPQRSDFAVSLAQGQDPVAEIITDAATQTGYVRIPALAQLGVGTGQWIAVPLNGLGSYLDTSIFSNFEKVTNASTVGTDNVNGVAVYHLRGGQEVQQGIAANATEDFYVRQDNSFPVRVVIQGSGTVPTEVAGASGDASAKITIDFTGVNTGISIKLPAGSQVQGS